VIPEVPAKSIVPSAAPRLSVNIIDGEATTIWLPSGRKTVRLVLTFVMTMLGEASVLSTPAEPCMVAVSVTSTDCRMPSPSSNRGIVRELDQPVVCSGTETDTESWSADTGWIGARSARASVRLNGRVVFMID
jgi:hypothetical protein